MDSLCHLTQWLERKPLILVRFDKERSNRLRESANGLGRFTLAPFHDAVADMKPPTLCLAEILVGDGTECYVGVLQRKAAVSTLNSRLTFVKLQPLALRSLDELPGVITETHSRNLLGTKLRSTTPVALTPKLSSRIATALWKNGSNRTALKSALLHLPGFRRFSNNGWGQRDAIRIAMKAFGLKGSEEPEEVVVKPDSDSALFEHSDRLLEDNVIGADASAVPGFSLVKKYYTGRAVFQKPGERLEIYTANRGPLERMLGVDLIYVNSTQGNTVMVQYKMLEPAHGEDGSLESRDWIFRPNKQFRKEMSRMRLPALMEKPAPMDQVEDYRLNRSPFYFKFVKRDLERSADPSSVIVSREHAELILSCSTTGGPRGGVRISYQALSGTYLRETDLIGLIRSGYIGTHRSESNQLAPIIKEVAEGNTALVTAWQRQVQTDHVPEMRGKAGAQS